MANFGTLEFVLDRYSGTWCWKISGTRAVNMVSKLIPRGWYGDKPDEVIVSDTDESIKKLKTTRLASFLVVFARGKLKTLPVVLRTLGFLVFS